MNKDIRKIEALNENELENISGGASTNVYLGTCNRCGREYNLLMPRCPHCGYSITDDSGGYI